MRLSESLFHRYRAKSKIYALLSVFLVTTAPLWADRQDDESRQVERTRIIRVAGPRGQALIHGLGVMSSRSYLGVEAIELTPELRAHFGVPTGAGVMVSRIAADSPAESAGLQVGDILTEVDDASITSFVDLFDKISGHEEGDIVRLGVWRGGEWLGFDATLAKQERPQIDIRHLRRGPEEERHTLVLPDGELDEVIELRTEALDEALLRLDEELGSAEWQQRLHSFGSNQKELLERLEALENRLRELEDELED
jgi:hypothetical protein